MRMGLRTVEKPLPILVATRLKPAPTSRGPERAADPDRFMPNKLWALRKQ